MEGDGNWMRLDGSGPPGKPAARRNDIRGALVIQGLDRLCDVDSAATSYAELSSHLKSRGNPQACQPKVP